MAKLKLAFMGSPDFSVPALEALIRAGHDVVCVYAQPPRPANRGQKLTFCPVHAAADAHGIPVRTPVNFKDLADVEAFRALKLDAAIVAAYGIILPKSILEAPRLGCLNIHASLLPRWRGAAPIQRAIEAGDPVTGITIMQMDEGLDTGDMLLKSRLDIGETMTGGELHDALSAIGAEMIGPALKGLAEGTLTPEPQPEDGVTYAKKLTKEEARLDFSCPNVELERRIRAFTPWPGTWFDCDGQRIKVLAASCETCGENDPGIVLEGGGLISCGDGALKLQEVQKAGKGRMTIEAFLRGNALQEGSRVR